MAPQFPSRKQRARYIAWYRGSGNERHCWLRTRSAQNSLNVSKASDNPSLPSLIYASIAFIKIHFAPLPSHTTYVYS